MPEIYVERRLLATDNGNEKTITEAEILSLRFPLVVLGDPGMGKTKLLESIAERVGGRRFSAGTFSRTTDVKTLKPSGSSPVIIDGLDELTASTGAAAVDGVLKKLSEIGRPPFILSCRAADWNGSADRYKIREDYGSEPIALTLEPFSKTDANLVLSARGLNADSVLYELETRDLDEFYKNPLTLKLIAEIVESNQGFPDGRAELLEHASSILIGEPHSEIHQREKTGMASASSLLHSAGAIFAHLLLSGTLGVADKPTNEVPTGFVPVGELDTLADAPFAVVVLKTRLFRSDEENVFTPYHRVIAEFLAGGWFANRVNTGLSERRVVQALTFAGGVPTALRGVHAWFGHFAPRMTETCIRADPYGALRYGDPDKLNVVQARTLLQSLSALANEDPYFRSEDWGRRAIAGLARPELKREILDLLKHPDRHVHLSSLILEALARSSLTTEIIPELLQIVEDEKAIYIERFNAANALANAKIDMDWVGITRKLRGHRNSESKRLALELMGTLDPTHFPSSDIADALLDYHGVLGEDSDEDRGFGSDTRLLRKISAEHSGEVLDAIAVSISPRRRNRHWRVGHRMGWANLSLLARALEGPPPSADRLWPWLRTIESDRSFREEESDTIAQFLRANTELRRNIHRLAFSDDDIEGGPWMAIVADLPQISPGLALTLEDSVFFLDEIATRSSLTSFDIELWASLLRLNGGHEGFPSTVEQALRRGIDAHQVLQSQWDQLTAPPKHDWRKRHEQQQRKANRERRLRLDQNRDKFVAQREEIGSGKAFECLYNLANGYLGRIHDLSHEAEPAARLRYWVGNDLTQAASAGFIAFLDQDDLPTAPMIGENHAGGKTFLAETVLVCGVSELIRTGQPLSKIRPEVLRACLAAWWEYPDMNARKIGDDLGPVLESAVFTSQEEIEKFWTDVIEPRIRAGQEHVSGLYQLARDERYRNIAGGLALSWLRRYPEAKPTVQVELVDIVTRLGPREDLGALARERCSMSIVEQQPNLRAIWVGTLFIVDFDHSKPLITRFCNERADNLWAIRSRIQAGLERSMPLSVQQLEFVVETFSEVWPPAAFPNSSQGDENPWDAARFIRSVIETLGAQNTQEASEALDRLVTNPSVARYRNFVRHARAAQQRLRRDSEYQVLSFFEAKSLLAGALPESIDDLKAFVRDALDSVQIYLRQGDTSAWKQFWSGTTALDENTCRNRLLDAVRQHVPKGIQAIPEIRMPDDKRADIGVLHNNLGLPVEMKGQWHPEVWHAPSSQLIDLYTKDHRANGRGIYLVLWFGSVTGKLVPTHPATGIRPTTPQQMREMLANGLDPAERTRVEVIVLDVSNTVPVAPVAPIRSRRTRTH